MERFRLTRRDVLERGTAALIATALPLARDAVRSSSAAADPLLADATLDAFYDTIIPGRKVATTSLGAPVHPRSIAGVDPRPGAVEADALAFGHHRLTGFDDLEAPFLADLATHALAHGGAFLALGWDARVATCISGLDFANPLRMLWEAAAGVAWGAFCAGALVPEQTAATVVGYAVMGLPGAAPNGYWNASYRRRLSRERTRTGSLP